MIKKAEVFDDDIQRMEVFAAWDAQFHLPKRLSYDYDSYGKVVCGGPIFRERYLKEHQAKLFNNKSNDLPERWKFLSNEDKLVWNLPN